MRDLAKSRRKYNPDNGAYGFKSQDKNGHPRRFKTVASMMSYLNKPERKKK